MPHNSDLFARAAWATWPVENADKRLHWLALGRSRPVPSRFWDAARTYEVSLGAPNPGETPDAEASHCQARVDQASQHVAHQGLHQGLAPREALGQELREQRHHRHSLGVLLRRQRAVQACDDCRHVARAVLTDEPGRTGRQRGSVPQLVQERASGKPIILKMTAVVCKLEGFNSNTCGCIRRTMQTAGKRGDGKGKFL